MFDGKTSEYTVFHTLRGHNDNIRGLAYDKLNNYLIRGCGANLIILWDLTNYTIKHKYELHTCDISGLCVLEGNRFASSSHDKIIMLCDYEGTKNHITIKYHSGYANRVYNATSVVGREILTGAGSDMNIGFCNSKGNVVGELLCNSWVFRLACYRDKYGRVCITHVNGPAEIWFWSG
jgi:WD40 repeat protein